MRHPCPGGFRGSVRRGQDCPTPDTAGSGWFQPAPDGSRRFRRGVVQGRSLSLCFSPYNGVLTGDKLTFPEVESALPMVVIFKCLYLNPGAFSSFYFSPVLLRSERAAGWGSGTATTGRPSITKRSCSLD